MGRRVVAIDSLIGIVVADADVAGAAAAAIGGGGGVVLGREGAAVPVVPVTDVDPVDNPDIDESVWGFCDCDCGTADDGIGNMDRDRSVEFESLSSIAFDFFGISSLPRLGMVVGIWADALRGILTVPTFLSSESGNGNDGLFSCTLTLLFLVLRSIRMTVFLAFSSSSLCSLLADLLSEVVVVFPELEVVVVRLGFLLSSSTSLSSSSKIRRRFVDIEKCKEGTVLNTV